MTGNSLNTTYKNGDDWGMVYHGLTYIDNINAMGVHRETVSSKWGFHCGDITWEPSSRTGWTCALCIPLSLKKKKGPLFQPRSLETQEMSGTYHAASYSPWHSVLFLSPNCDSSPFGVLLWQYPYNRVLEFFLLVPNSSNCRCIYNKPYLTSYGYRFTRVFGHPQTFLQWSHHRRQPGDLGDFIQECWAIYSHWTCDLPCDVGAPSSVCWFLSLV